MNKRILALVFALMLIALPALAVPSAPKDVYVLDEANVLSAATEAYIISNNALLDDACGAQIVIVAVDDTEGEAIDDYAYDIFNKWGIGSASKNNGILLLMAIDDDNYYCEPGVGLESRLSGGAIKLMLDEYLEPDFAAKDYDAGARKLFDAIFTEINDMYSAGVTLTAVSGNSAGSHKPISVPNRVSEHVRDDRASGDDGAGLSVTAIIVIVLIIVVLIMIVRSSRRRRRTAPPPPPPHNPVPPVKPVVKPIIRPIIRPTIFTSGPRPGSGPRPTPRNNPPHMGGSFGGGIFGGGTSRPGSSSRSRSRSSFGGGISRGGGAGRSFSSSRPSTRSSGSRSFGGGRSRGGGAGRGR